MSEYYDPEDGREISADDLKEMDVSRRAEIIKHWFFQHYEDPAENTPYESAEGGYIYIWGGPHDASEVLWAQFGGIVEEEELQNIAQDLEQSENVMEWASIPEAEDYDSTDYSTSEFHPRFKKGLEQLRFLLAQSSEPYCQPALFALLYAHVITLLEAYLSDVFRSLVVKHNALLRRFVESEPAFADKKFSLTDLFSQMEKIEETAKQHLYVLPFHRLEKVGKMYSSVLGIKFKAGLGEVYKAIQKRHHIIHRNGIDNDGKAITITAEDVEALANIVESWISEMDSEISHLVVKLSFGI